MRGDCDKTLLLEIIQGHAHNRFLKLLGLKITLVEAVQAFLPSKDCKQPSGLSFCHPPRPCLSCSADARLESSGV